MYQKRDFKELYMYVATTLRVQKEQKTKENDKNPSFSMLICCQYLPLPIFRLCCGRLMVWLKVGTELKMINCCQKKERAYKSE